MRLVLKKLTNDRIGSYERDEVAILKEQIKMCRSHQNYSNWDLIEDQIAAIILRIMKLEGVEFEREKKSKELCSGGTCEFCETTCGNEWCVTKKRIEE